MMPPEIDVVVLSRDSGSLVREVHEGLRAQEAVFVRLHRVIGTIHADDRTRFQTIARARNRGKTRGTAHWLMFVDDDVVLPPTCMRTLLDELCRYPTFGAMAADYLGERSYGPRPHVTMGATMFRRAALDRITFRAEERRCDCQCCCDDLRSKGFGIGYSSKTVARHLKSRLTRRAQPIASR